MLLTTATNHVSAFIHLSNHNRIYRSSCNTFPSIINHFSPADQTKYLCKYFRSRWDGSLSHLDLLYLPLGFNCLLIILFAIMVTSKFKDGRVKFTNTGLNGLNTNLFHFKLLFWKLLYDCSLPGCLGLWQLAGLVLLNKECASFCLSGLSSKFKGSLKSLLKWETGCRGWITDTCSTKGLDGGVKELGVKAKSGIKYNSNMSRQKTYLQICVLSGDSDQALHSCSLIRIFTGRILGS